MKKAISSVKSGMKNEEYMSKVLKGAPPKKSVEAINKANTPGKCKDAYRD